MDPSTINAQTFTVRDSSGHSVGGVVSYDASYEIASFQPSPVLQPAAMHLIALESGAGEVITFDKALGRVPGVRRLK
jgi:hypothetical protein